MTTGSEPWSEVLYFARVDVGPRSADIDSRIEGWVRHPSDVVPGLYFISGGCLVTGAINYTFYTGLTDAYNDYCRSTGGCHPPEFWMTKIAKV